MSKNKNCPICHQDNQCNVDSINACWCSSTSIPLKLLKLLPEEERKKVCICKKCVIEFNQNEESFKRKYNLK